MTEAYLRFEEIAGEHGLIPRYLREIVYLSEIGYKQNEISEITGYTEETVAKYRRKLWEMDEEDAAEIFWLVAQIKRS